MECKEIATPEYPVPFFFSEGLDKLNYSNIALISQIFKFWIKHSISLRHGSGLTTLVALATAFWQTFFFLIKMQMNLIIAHSQAMEQLYLMSEIENFYPLSAFLRAGLENWIIHHKSPNNMDILQWAPRDSKVLLKCIHFISLTKNNLFRVFVCSQFWHTHTLCEQ